jgi:2-methylcitrate dehydratase PrpD
MSMNLIDRICHLAIAPRTLTEEELSEALLAFEDTMAVAFAGWHEPVTQALLSVYSGGEVELIDGSTTTTVEHAAFIHAVAGHVLDYDDVHLISVTHPSVVLVPAILSLIGLRPELKSRALPAYAVGLAVNIALGRVLGFSHYDRGWHATSTIGALAGAAATAHFLGLDEDGVRNALALAAPQAGGLQQNFGTMAKSVQAGYAAAAAVRAGLMSEAGISGARDIIGSRGFIDLYQGKEQGENLDNVPIQIEVDTLSRKLYPCCYLTHRMIAAALSAREQLGGIIPDGAKIEVKVPFGTMRPLHILDPHTGLEAKFCGTYTIATALAQGSVGLSDFENDSVMRPEIRRLMQQIRISEKPMTSQVQVGIGHGVVEIGIHTGEEWCAEASVVHYPGSPGSPLNESQVSTKIDDCLTLYSRRAGVSLRAELFRSDLRTRLGF